MPSRTNAVAIETRGPNIRNKLRALSQTAPDENKNKNDCALTLLWLLEHAYILLSLGCFKLA